MSSLTLYIALYQSVPPAVSLLTPQDAETARWFHEEVQPHEPTLRGYLHGIAASSDIDDLVQETYVRLFRARTHAIIRSSRGLLFAIARNVARDLFRRRAVANTIPITEMDDCSVIDSAPYIPEIISRRQEVELLEAAIGELPERCRTVLILRKFNNLSHKEIASRLHIAEHTVEAHLTKALRRCEAYFEKKGAFSSTSP